ncbi:DUF4124 domain-containing protein [Methylomonas rivi]|uniref:DUF4124 domain-containing protein n=1 Tax=Methylomonas rivi TaxID=2952226 RepID=A0ABT1U5G1_9GAMM|nr:DUF4124 domain-containing protein [Methylomonas sp. WSC-6]MBS4051782.1 DUF4124 domain-containing protein [Methylomonas sp.]MCQ8129097.1 DUF4124 domain-containing protein [Methylomonas sp. WSC-6]
MRIMSVLCLMLMSATAHAEVFKCMEKFGKAVYQSRPCTDTSKEQQLDIKTTPDPAQEAAAKAKLEAVQAEYQAQKTSAAERQTKQNQEAAAIESARRSALLQQQQAEAQQKQAEALERQNRFLFRPLNVLR